MNKRVMLLLVLVCLFSSFVIADNDPNLVGCWKFNDTTVSYALDSSGNDNHGILQGDAVKSNWAYNGAMMFYDEGDYVEVPHDDIFNFTDQMTLMAWVRMSLDKNDVKIVSKGSAFCFGRDYDNDYLVVTCNGLGRPMSGSMTVCDHKWHHVAVVYDGSALSIYVDGQLDRSKSVSGTITPNTDSLLIGNLSEVNDFEWSGHIDDVRIYNRPLSADEIEMFYYPFDINDDNIIDIFDVQLIAQKWLSDGDTTTADTDSDGVVGFKDYGQVAKNFDNRVPPEDAKWKNLVTVERSIPQPLPDHPGNIYLEGETVVVAVPPQATSAVTWQLIDDVNQIVAYGDMPDIIVEGLGIGWYWVSFRDASDQEIAHSTAAVLAQLKAPIPQDSPVCVDMATAWFYNNTTDWGKYTNLATLAGISIIRDRMRWREMEPSKEVFTTDYTKYDETADIQTAAGLKVLQVFHDKPSWSPVRYEAFPEDLRDLYKFCKEMAIRFKDRVHAWEPWNEANASGFGGMTIDEMCCLQKAAYLGFKAGDPNVIVGWNPYGGYNTDFHTLGVLKNEAWSYYDTYNTHTYGCPHNYNSTWEPLRQAACGKPIWITESDRGMSSQTGSPYYDFDYPHEVLKAKFMAQSYASTLYAGASRHFHFILGPFGTTTQMGLLREDFTPRAGYVALAAVGRFMAGAKPVGRIYEADDSAPCHVYAFHAKPDGVERDLIVAWAESHCSWENRDKTVADWPITKPLEVEAIYDHYGRYIGTEIPQQLTGQAVFIILKPGQLDGIDWQKQEHYLERPQKPYQVMIQLKMRRYTTDIGGPTWSSEPDHVITPDVPTDIDIWAYNFSDTTVTGQVVTEELPFGFSLSPSTWNITIEPMGRVQLPATATIQANPEVIEDHENWFVLKGQFDDGSEPVLAFRLLDHWEKDGEWE